MNPSSLNLLLFDLDGTLFRSTDLLPVAYREGIQAFNRDRSASVAMPSRRAVLDQIGNPVDEIYRNLFPSLDPNEVNQLAERVEGILISMIRRGEGDLIDGTEEVLERLQGRVPLGIVTNARRTYLDAVSTAYRFERWFDRMLCLSDAEEERKALLIQSQLDEFGVKAEQTLLVGDRSSDREAARQTGVHFIGCTFGYGGADEFDGFPTIDSLPDLLECSPVRDLPVADG